MINSYKDIKPLIIGIGVAGTRHLEAQVKFCNKTGIFSTNPQTIAKLKENPKIVIFNNLEMGIEWANLIHICTPDDRHTGFVALALKRGKAVLCEKSLTTNLNEALHLQALAHKYSATLIIGHNYRLTPSFLETRKKALAGYIGTITSIQTTYLHDKTQYQKRAPIRKNQDFLYIGGSHAIDLALFIGGRITNVRATSTTDSANRYPPVYDIVLKFDSGLIGYVKLDASNSRKISGTDLKVYGTKGQLVSHNKVDNLIFHTTDKKFQSLCAPNTKIFTVAKEIEIVNNFLSGNTPSFWPLPGVDEAINTIRVLDTIQKAVLAGKSESIVY